MSWQLQHGDCRELMAAMPEASVDSIVTDPPYELTSARPGGRSPATEGKVMKGFMGMKWDGSGVAFDPAMWAVALRVLKSGGWLLAFGGARTYHRMACAIEDAGFDIRDQIMWIYGSGFPKGGVRDGIGTCLKPAHEPIVMARKPLVGSARANIAALGTGGLNIDACRVGETGARNNGRQAGKNGIYGHIGATTPIDYGMGRWPSNVAHDGSDEVVAGFPVAPGQLADASTSADPRKSQNVYGAMRGGRGAEPSALSENVGSVEFGMRPGARRHDGGSSARFFYCAKASKADRDEGLDAFDLQRFVQFQTGNGESGKASSLSEGRATEYRNTHPTVKPEALMRWLVRLVTPVGGTVLDPFTGSGSTGKAALLEERRFVGCELTAEYIPIAEARMAAAAHRAEATLPASADQPGLFDEEAA